MTYGAMPNGESLSIKYDRYGRLLEIYPGNGENAITIEMSEMDKPTLFDVKNVGSIKVTYDDTGDIINVDIDSDEGKIYIIITQVIRLFAELAEAAKLR